MERLRNLKIFLNRHQGFGALPLMLVLGAVMIGTAVLGGATIILRNNILAGARGGALAFFTAKAGVEDGIMQVVRNKNFSSPGYSTGELPYVASVVVLRDAPATGATTVTATSSILSRLKTVRAVLNINGFGQVEIISFGEIVN